MGLDKEGWEKKQRQIMPSIQDDTVTNEQLKEWYDELYAQAQDLEAEGEELEKELDEINNLENGAEKNQRGNEYNKKNKIHNECVKISNDLTSAVGKKMHVRENKEKLQKQREAKRQRRR